MSVSTLKVLVSVPKGKVTVKSAKFAGVVVEKMARLQGSLMIREVVPVLNVPLGYSFWTETVCVPTLVKVTEVGTWRMPPVMLLVAPGRVNQVGLLFLADYLQAHG